MSISQQYWIIEIIAHSAGNIHDLRLWGILSMPLSVQCSAGPKIILRSLYNHGT